MELRCPGKMRLLNPQAWFFLCRGRDRGWLILGGVVSLGGFLMVPIGCSFWEFLCVIGLGVKLYNFQNKFG
jgi:hypothetical protein